MSRTRSEIEGVHHQLAVFDTREDALDRLDDLIAATGSDRPTA